MFYELKGLGQLKVMPLVKGHFKKNSKQDKKTTLGVEKASKDRCTGVPGIQEAAKQTQTTWKRRQEGKKLGAA